jgi:hypothetical protein
MKRLLAWTLLLLAIPAAADARKNAWQLSSLSGTYEYHATNPNPGACSPGSAVLLSRDYTETWHADSFGRGQYVAKYFPVFGGPQTNGAGQKAHLVHQGTLTETYRTGCDEPAQTCTKAVTSDGSRTVFMVTHRRPGSRPYIQWYVDFANSIGDCAPADVAGELLPSGDPSPVAQSTTNTRFTRKRAKFSVSGHGFSAKATLKKVVIPDGCADTKPQRLFVCK